MRQTAKLLLVCLVIATVIQVMLALHTAAEEIVAPTPLPEAPIDPTPEAESTLHAVQHTTLPETEQVEPTPTTTAAASDEAGSILAETVISAPTLVVPEVTTVDSTATITPTLPLDSTATVTPTLPLELTDPDYLVTETVTTEPSSQPVDEFSRQLMVTPAATLTLPPTVTATVLDPELPGVVLTPTDTATPEITETAGEVPTSSATVPVDIIATDPIAATPDPAATPEPTSSPFNVPTATLPWTPTSTSTSTPEVTGTSTPLVTTTAVLTLTPTPGGTFLMTKPEVAPFPAVRLNGKDQIVAVPLGSFTVIDERGTGAGWRVVVHATQAREVDQTGAYVEGGKALPSGSLSLDAPGLVSSSEASALPSLVREAVVIDRSAPVTIARAVEHTGMGTFQFGASTLRLTVPATAYARTYRSEVTVSIVSGP